MKWPTIGLAEEDSWSYGFVTEIESDAIRIQWFHRELDHIYKLSYAIKYFKRVENGKG
jgi:hypothetical protein